MAITDLKHILITGANTGIGFATVKSLLEQFNDTKIFLGSRNLKKGQDAVNKLIGQNNLWKDRLSCLQIDVSSDQSVESAAKKLQESNVMLYGVVNNAGVAGSHLSNDDVININVFGPWRVVNCFSGLLQSNGRIVNISSAAGPSFISSASEDIKQCLLDKNVTWDQIKEITDKFLDLNQRQGESVLPPVYGFSKACLNAYTVYLSKKYPDLIINSCTPGFIETNLTQPFLESSGKSAQEYGMKPPEHATKVINHLLMDAISNRGHYFGSDAKRSPLDRYRSPGDPPHNE